jgi:hypothetical protein
LTMFVLPERLKVRDQPREDLSFKRDCDVASVLDVSFRVVGGEVSEIGYYGDINLGLEPKGRVP